MYMSHALAKVGNNASPCYNIPCKTSSYFMLSSRFLRNMGEIFFLYFMVTTSENNDFYIISLQLKAETVLLKH